MINQRNKTGGGILILNELDFKAGLGAQGQFGTNTLIKQTDSHGWAYLNNIDPFNNYGILSPAQNPSATFANSSSMAGVLVASQFINNTFMYGIDAGGNVHYIQYGAATFSVTSGTALGVSWPHTITGTTPVGQDELLYRHNSGSTSVVSLFYSYYNSVNWNVGAFVNQTTFSDAYMSTSPATPLDIATASPADGRDVNQKSAPHPLCIGADGILYIGSGRYLHGYDGNTGSDGTFSSRVLTLPQGFQIIAIRKYQDQLLIVGNYYSNQGTGADGTGEALMYTWNYVDLDITQVIPLEDPYVTALFIWKGYPTVITNGKVERNGQNKIKIISGTSVMKIGDFDGATPIQRGIIVASDVLYINSGGKIISFGDKFIKSNALNHVASTSQTGTSGILVYNYTQPCLLASSANGSTYVINNFIGNGYASAIAYPNAYQPIFPFGYMGRIKSIQVEYFKTLTATGGTGNLTLILLTDFHTVSQNILTNLGTVAAPLLKRYYVNAAGNALPTFNTIGFEFVWSVGSDVPLISSVAVEYEDIALLPNT